MDIGGTKATRRLGRRGLGGGRVEHGLHFVLDDRHIGHGTGGLQGSVPCVGKSQNNVKVLGIGQVVQEGEDAPQVQPPCDALGRVQGLGAPALHGLCEPSAHRKGIGPGMHGNVCGVHDQQGPHQDDFDDEDDLGIPSGPAV